MRLGGPVFENFEDPARWVSAHRELGWSAAFVNFARAGNIDDYAAAAAEADIVLAEVGAWSSPISCDAEHAKGALEKCKKALALAEQLGARCCVNVSGSRSEHWSGPHPDNLTGETFEMIVGYVREIIDEVEPARTFYTLETMPWMYPDSADAYLRLIKAIDRPQFAVHFDPVNLICSPQRYFNTGAVIEEFVAKLGPHIRSCHAKDILLRNELTTHLEEVVPGLGRLDYPAYLRSIAKLDRDVPIMIEHLKSRQQYAEAASYIRGVAQRECLRFQGAGHGEVK